MRKVIRGFGLALVIWGLVLIFIGQVSITGFVIVGDLNFEWRFVLGLVLVVGGFLIFMSSREKVSVLEGVVDVYDATNGKNPSAERDYHLLDPYLSFGRADITLRDFKQGIVAIREDEELFSIVKGEYGPPLIKLREAGGEKGRIATQFLNVLGYTEEDSINSRDLVSPEERKEIKDTFKEWDGSLSRRQREMLDKYNIGYEKSRAGSHWHLTYGEKMVTASSSSSDWKAGRNVASDLLRMIEHRRKNKR